MTLHKQLLSMRACSAAVAWVGKRTIRQAWAECERGDWMLWFAVRVGVDRKLIVAAACDCAETTIQYVREESLLAALWAIDAARRWSSGTTGLDEVRAAADAATHATTTSAANAAVRAAIVRGRYVAAACAAYAATSQQQSLARGAELVRERISADVVVAAMLRSGR